jgi:hypothetical protein
MKKTRQCKVIAAAKGDTEQYKAVKEGDGAEEKPSERK